MSPYSDQRHAGRLRCESLDCQLGEVIDISASGLKLRSAKRGGLRVGESVVLELTRGQHKIIARAKVVWVKGRWPARPTVGLRFTEPAERLAQVKKLALMAAASQVDPMSLVGQIGIIRCNAVRDEP